MARLTLNGRVYEVPDASHVRVEGDRVLVNGHQVADSLSGVLRVEWHGPLANLSASTAVTCGDVRGDVTAGSSVACGDVGLNVSAGSAVHCRDVGGDVRAGSSVDCGKVRGRAYLGGAGGAS